MKISVSTFQYNSRWFWKFSSSDFPIFRKFCVRVENFIMRFSEFSMSEILITADIYLRQAASGSPRLRAKESK